MKGSLHTDELMGAVVAREGGIRTERRSIAHTVGQWPLFQHCNRPRCRLRMIAIRSSRRSAVARTNAWSARIPTDPTGTTNETVAPDCGLSRNVTDAPRLARRPGKPAFPCRTSNQAATWPIAPPISPRFATVAERGSIPGPISLAPEKRLAFGSKESVCVDVRQR
jgi:hypothetical protein